MKIFHGGCNSDSSAKSERPLSGKSNGRKGLEAEGREGPLSSEEATVVLSELNSQNAARSGRSRVSSSCTNCFTQRSE